MHMRRLRRSWVVVGLLLCTTVYLLFITKKTGTEDHILDGYEGARSGWDNFPTVSDEFNDFSDTFSDDFSESTEHDGEMHLAVVACGEMQRVEEVTTMIKSAVLMARKFVNIHIFAEDNLNATFHNRLDSFPHWFKKKFTYEIYPITFPDVQFPQDWKKMFKLCASQRLFIPDLLKDIDSLLYVDTDILFLRPIDDVWDHFHNFNNTQLAALVPEHEDPGAGWYNRFAQHPYYGAMGLNSGVLLMNMTRMRAFGFREKVLKYYDEYKNKLVFGDQDLLNILFHFYPHLVYVYPCEWNYRPDHCMYMSVCKTAEINGIHMLHGSRGVLHNDEQPVFRAMYEMFRDLPLTTTIVTALTLVDNVKTKMAEAVAIPKKGACRNIGELLVSHLVSHVFPSSQDSAGD